MKILNWNIYKGGREKTNEILNEIKSENCDIVTLTGFKLNHNKNILLNGLKNIGYKYIFYNKKSDEHKEIVLIATKTNAELLKYNDKNEEFLMIKKDDFYIAGMNFVYQKNQKEIVQTLKNKSKKYINDKLIIIGNMQTAKNYATPNSEGKKMCKKYIDFKEIGLINTMKEYGCSTDKYTWKSKSGCEYNVDFILAKKEVISNNTYCYCNNDVIDKGVSPHAKVILNIL